MTPLTVLRAAQAHIRDDPVLGVPFAIVGGLIALADWLRQWDPIPVATPASFEQTISVQYSVFPQGTARTVRHIGALVDLRTPYFFGAVALELLVLLAIGVAGWLTITRALGCDRRLDSLARYLGGLSAVAALSWGLGPSMIVVDSLLLGVVALIATAFVVVHLFLFPGFLVAGSQFTTALQQSVRAAPGMRWALFGLIIGFGLALWGLAQIPTVGGGLSTAVVAPFHAVSIAVLLRR